MPMHDIVGQDLKIPNFSCFDVGLARPASYFPLLAQRKVTKAKGTPCHGLWLPCAAQQIRRLRNSLRSDSPRRKLLTCLRCSAWQQGIKSQNHFSIVIPSLTRNPASCKKSLDSDLRRNDNIGRFSKY